MEELIDDSTIKSIVDSFNEALEYEFYIKFKKENGIPLNADEKFFDDYFIPPSFLIKFLLKEDKK